MQPESQEFVQYRTDLLAKEHWLARRQARDETAPEPEQERELNGRCLCCGRLAYIPPQMHVCLPCHQL